MKRTLSSSLVLLVSTMLFLSGCKGRESASNTASNPAKADSSGNSNQKSQESSANRNTNTSKETQTPAPPVSASPPQLIGTYEVREIEDKGVVTVVSKIRTIISFSSDGAYSRASLVNGKTYHSDSGSFRIDAPDKLVLTIQVAGQGREKKMQSPPISKTHKFNLSPDGDELRLTSEKGATALFQRVAKPKSS